MADQTAQPPPPTPPRRAVSPLKAFAIVGMVGLAGGIALFRPPGNEQATTTLGTSRSASPSPLSAVDAERIFEALRGKALRVGLERDPSVIQESMVEGGPLAKRSERLIERLRRSKVVDETSFRLLDMQLLEVGPTEMTFRTRHDVRPCFLTERGKDVTDAPSVVRQSVDWTLQKVDELWLIYDTALTDEKVLKPQGGGCA